MKKVFSALLALMLVMSASVTAFGATVSDVEKPLKSAADYLYSEKESFTAQESKDLYLYLVSGADGEKYQNGWCESVKQGLEDGTLSGIGNMALVIYDALMLGMDPTDFDGVNLVELFENTPLSEYDNPYLDMYAADIAVAFGLDEFGRKICDRLASKYTMGVGTDFWGGGFTGVDDLGVFVSALANYEEDYKAYIDDAIALIKTHNTDEGYDNYGANANSTAVALAAAVCVNDKAMADDAYHKLMLFYDEESGCFTSNYDDEIATKDAIFGLSYYLGMADKDEPVTDKPSEPSTEQPTEKPAQKPAETAEPSEKPADKNEPAKSPATGASGISFSVFAILASGSVILAARKKEN